MERVTRRKFIAGGIAGTAVALAGCSRSPSYGEGHKIPENEVTSVSIPENPSEYTYPLMGSGDADVTVYYFGSFKCPFCADFGSDVLPGIVSEYISSGDVNLQFRSLAFVGDSRFLGQDAPRIANADLAVWENDPDQYWTFHEYVFENQPPESETWGSTSNLMNFINGSNVESTDQIKSEIEEQAYETEVQDTTDTASGLGVSGTPTLYVNDKLINGLEENAIYNAIDEALQN